MQLAATRLAHIGSTHGREGCGHSPQIAAQSFEHIGNYPIFANAQMIRIDLNRLMAIAQMPGQLQKSKRGCSPNLIKFLGLGQDLDDPSVFKLQSIAMVQAHGLGKGQHEIEAVVAGQLNAAAITVPPHPA